jgi:colicin import membrane protein
MKTLYDILGVDMASGKEEIESAYRDTVKHLSHSIELNPHDSKDLHLQLDAVKRAYRTLSDPVARNEYDVRMGVIRGMSDRQSTNSFLSQPKNLGMILVFVVAIVYIASEYSVKTDVVDVADKKVESDINRDVLALSNDISKDTRKNDIAEKALESDIEHRERMLELENERLRRQYELAQAEQERKNRELQAIQEAQNRLLDLENRKVDIVDNEIKAERKYTNEVRNYDRIDRNVQSYNNVIDLHRDAGADKRGVSREEYDQYRNRSSNRVKHWNN